MLRSLNVSPVSRLMIRILSVQATAVAAPPVDASLWFLSVQLIVICPPEVNVPVTVSPAAIRSGAERNAPDAALLASPSPLAGSSMIWSRASTVTVIKKGPLASRPAGQVKDAVRSALALGASVLSGPLTTTSVLATMAFVTVLRTTTRSIQLPDGARVPAFVMVQPTLTVWPAVSWPTVSSRALEGVRSG